MRLNYLKLLQVIDLLNIGTSRKPLAVRWSKKHRGFFVENLFTVDCEELDDLLAVLEEGIPYILESIHIVVYIKGKHSHSSVFLYEISLVQVCETGPSVGTI